MTVMKRTPFSERKQESWQAVRASARKVAAVYGFGVGGFDTVGPSRLRRVKVFEWHSVSVT